MPLPVDIAQGTNATPVNPTNWNTLVNGINGLKDTYSKEYIFDVKHEDFGAKGDGITDDNASIQLAINAASILGGTVFIPPGTYLVTGLLVASNVNYIGTGWNSILKLKDSSNESILVHANTSNVNNIRIANLAFDGNKANNTSGSAISFGGQNIVVEGCYFHDMPHAGVNIESSVSGGGKIRILNNWCHNPALSGNYWGAFAVTSGDDVIISGNIATEDDGFMAYGITIEPNTGWTVSNVIIDNNIIYDGRIVVGGDGTITNVKITNNDVRWATTTLNTTSPITVLSVLGKVKISNNEIEGPTTLAPCIYLTDLVGAMVTGNRITQNAIDQGTYPVAVGILLSNTTYSDISNNFIFAPIATSGCGIREVDVSAFNSYADNHFYQIGVHYAYLTTPVALDGSASQLQALDANGLKLYDDGGNGIFIKDGGNVGIGTVAPTQKLQIQQTVNADLMEVLYNPSTGNAARARLYVAASNAEINLFAYGSGHATSPNVSELYAGANSEFRIMQASSSPLTFFTNTTERMRLGATGGLAVGETTDPGAGNIKANGYYVKSVSPAITASVTQTQGQGALTADINVITVCANTNDTVTLPTAVAGRQVYIFNKGANSARIYPASGDNLGAGVNACTATPIPTGKSYMYTAYDTTNWIETILN